MSKKNRDFLGCIKSGSGDPILQKNEVHRVKKSQKSEFQLVGAFGPFLATYRALQFTEPRKLGWGGFGE